MAWLGYGIGVFAPGVSSADTGAYEVAHNIIRSHTRAYRTYETSFKTLQQGASIIGFQHLSVLSWLLQWFKKNRVSTLAYIVEMETGNRKKDA